MILPRRKLDKVDFYTTFVDLHDNRCYDVVVIYWKPRVVKKRFLFWVYEKEVTDQPLILRFARGEEPDFEKWGIYFTESRDHFELIQQLKRHVSQ